MRVHVDVCGLRSVAATALVLGALAACTAGSGPVPSPVLSPSVDEALPPILDAQAAPTQPADWDRVDVHGATAVATHLMALYDHAYGTGDLSEWNALSDPECLYCESVRTSVTESFAAGERTEGGRLEVLDARGEVVAPDEAYRMDLRLKQHPYRTISRDGDTTGWSSEESVSLRLLVLREHGSWIIREVEIVGES